MAINQVTSTSGKTKWCATVWWKGKFISQATFATKGLATTFERDELQRAVEGTAVPAAIRRQQREAEQALQIPMSSLVPGYLKENKHGEKRAAEYDLVGRLLNGKTLADFQGEEGGRLIKAFADEWRYLRLPRTKKAGAVCASKEPIKSQTLRLRLGALLRLIEYGRRTLPKGAKFILHEDAYNFEMPPAYENKRGRRASDQEMAELLRLLGSESAFGHFLRVMDETGCRVSEIANATGAAVSFFSMDGTVLGGSLSLARHKTSKKTGTRDVPLSLFAARLLHARKVEHGEGKLFPDLPTPNDICKDFDAACVDLKLQDLMMKDIRREFISRNLREVSGVEMRSFIGDSPLITETASDKAVMKAVGHTRPQTTQVYTAPEQDELSFVFTKTSRWQRVQALMQGRTAQASERKERLYAALLQLSDTLDAVASAGQAVAA